MSDPLALPPLGLGCSSFGDLFGPVSDADIGRMVAMEVEKGRGTPFRAYFDVAPWYGTAEARLGRALRPHAHARDDFVVSTKVGRYRPAPGVMDFSAARTRRSVEASLDKLGVETLDIVFVHDVELAPSPSEVVDGCVPALLDLRARQRIRYLGISGYPLDVLLAYIDRVPRGTFAYAMTYSHLNLHDAGLVDYMPRFAERGVRVISAAPLSMGLLTDAGPPAWHPAPPGLRAAAVRAREAAGTQTRTLEAVALRYSLRLAGRIGAASTVCGARTPAELAANWAVSSGTDADETDADAGAVLVHFEAPGVPRSW